MQSMSEAGFIARLLCAVSPAALERTERALQHAASWGSPRRCSTNECCPFTGDCLLCGAINGEACKA